MILYLMLILNMPFIFFHGNGNMAKKINQAWEKNFFEKDPIRSILAGNQKEDGAINTITNHTLISTLALGLFVPVTLQYQ